MDKEKALEAAISQIERAFGKGSIMRLGQNEKAVEVEAISTGSLGLDIALGIGGLPRGRVVEIYGPEILGQDHAGSACRRRGAEAGRHLRLHRCRACARSGLCAEARRRSRGAADLPARHRRAGARDRRHSGALRRRRRAGDRFGRRSDAQGRARRRDGRHADAACQARLMSQALRKLTASISKSRCMVIFINQIRMKIGVMFGNPETTTGGNALKFYASVRLDIRRIGADQGPRGGGRQPDPREGGQEQGGPALQAGRVRHHVWRGHLQDRRAGRSRRQGRRRREVGRLVLL